MRDNSFPYTSDDTQSYRGVNWAAVGGFIGIPVGAAFIANKPINRTQDQLEYLKHGLMGHTVGEGKEAYETLTREWQDVAGRKHGNVLFRDFMLDRLKAFEESLFGIPRTFDLFALASQSMSAPTGSIGTRVKFDPTYVENFRDYLEKEIGRQLEAHELAYGVELREYATGVTKKGKQVTEVGLFATLGGDDQPILKRARVMQRFWAPPGHPEDEWHRSRLAATRQRIHGLRAVPAAFVDRGVATQGNVSHDPFLIVGGSSKREHAMRNMHAVATELSARYFRLLDDPIEFIRDLAGKSHGMVDRIAGGAQKTPVYRMMTNIFGIGGGKHIEGKGFVDLWKRHLAHAGPRIGALYAGYHVASALTKPLFGEDVYQLGTKAVANAELMGAKLSSMTGLTDVAQSQEQTAPGSTSLAGLAAFPASAYLAGWTAGTLRTRWISKKQDSWGWSAARAKTHQLPDWLKWLDNRPMTRAAQWGTMAAVGTAALIAPFIPGAIGTTKTPEEVSSEMAGETEVAIKKGRFWEMGRTPYEGGAVDYFRPNYRARALIDARDKGVYGEYADKPFTRALKTLVDPYWVEKMHYQDRPYPVTGPSDAGWGPLGSIWAATLGRIFKPPKLMHTEELGGSEGEYRGKGGIIAERMRKGEEPSLELGGKPGSAPISPYSAEYQAGELFYRTQEAVGLPGFILGAIKKKLTGSADIFDEAPVLATAADITSSRRGYWDLQLGGAATASEAYRRFNANKRFQIEEVNPLKNTMPTWMPGEDYYINFQTGDPYAKIAEGELRLPGAGFEERYPELQGLAMEDYPAAYRMKILGDVAPYSREYTQAKEDAKRDIAAGVATAREAALVDQTVEQERIRKEGRQFTSREEDRGLLGDYWATLVRAGRSLPTEHLFPLSPIHKFAGETDVVTAYRDERVMSTDYPSWGRPVDHFLRPGVNATLGAVGLKGIPGPEQERRDIEEHFDMLEYVKQKALSRALSDEGRGREAWAASRRAEHTKFGVDPFSRRAMVERVLDKRDRDYIRSMMDLETEDEQRKAIELVPENIRPILEAQYLKRAYVHLAAQDTLSDRDEAVLEEIEELRATEGQMARRSDWGDYQRAVTKGQWDENQFADFLRMRRAEEYFADHKLPDADWIGWRDDVELEDIKLKMVTEEGKDFHDYGGWESQIRDLSRKPYLRQAVRELMEAGTDSEPQVFRMLNKSGHTNIQISQRPASEDSTSVVISQDNTSRINELLYRMGVLS